MLSCGWLTAAQGYPDILAQLSVVVQPTCPNAPWPKKELVGKAKSLLASMARSTPGWVGGGEGEGHQAKMQAVKQHGGVQVYRGTGKTQMKGRWDMGRTDCTA